MRHAGFARNFESTLRLLAERGHELHVAFDAPFAHAGSGGAAGIVERLAAEHPSVTFGAAPDRSRERWSALGVRLRMGVDYLRFLGPAYAGADKLRARAGVRTGVLLRWLGRVAARRRDGPAALARVLRILERALPISPGAIALVRAFEPDVVLVTPLVELGEPQTDFVRAAKSLGVPTGLCVASWDNLTNKGMVSEVPELVTVWNEAQREEAVRLHGVPPEHIVATGAQSYDHWFEWSPSRERAAFAARVQLPADRPLVLYLCSSDFIAPDEAFFVRRWLVGLRARLEPDLRDAAVLVRPHPQNATQWRSVDLSGLGPASVWPRAGADPIDLDSRRDYFDSIHHCAAVVGVNTSALIESAIVGRPVFTYLAPEFRDTQRGTPHFAHLADGGPLRVAESFEEHASELAVAVGGGGSEDRGRTRAFLRSFVRPHGLDVPATPLLVDAIEGLAGVRAESPRAPGSTQALRVLLAPIASFVAIEAIARGAVRECVRRALGVSAVRGLARRVLSKPADGDGVARRHLRALMLEDEAARQPWVTSHTSA